MREAGVTRISHLRRDPKNEDIIAKPIWDVKIEMILPPSDSCDPRIEFQERWPSALTDCLIFRIVDFWKTGIHSLSFPEESGEVRSMVLPRRIIFALPGLVMLLIFLQSIPVLASKDPMLEMTVTRGDFLIHICEKYLENPKAWPEIAKLNGLKNPHRIYPGQRLLIPVKWLRGVPLTCDVAFLKGDVRVRKESTGPWIPLHLADKVTQGSSLQTGQESSVELRFEDGTTLFLRPGTLLSIETAQRKGLGYILREYVVEIGKVLARIRKATGAETRDRIQTPSAVASARGTEFRVSVDSEGSTRSEVLKGMVEVEAMNKTVELREEEGTWVKRGEPPASPRKLLPPPTPLDLKPLYRRVPFQLAFGPIKEAAQFRVSVTTDLMNKDLLQEKVVHPEEGIEMTDLPDGSYYLFTQSIDEAGLEGSLSEPFVLKVRVNPLPPFIEAPPSDTEFRERSIEIRWLKVEDAASYHVQVAEDEAFTLIQEENREVQGGSYRTGDLNYRTYYFRVRSIGRDGYEGEWSPTVRFSVIPPPPSPPLEKPEPGEKAIQLRWRPPEGIRHFHFQMARDQTFREVLIDAEVHQPSIVIPKPEIPGIYYVRTSSIDLKGYEGEFSAPQSFEIKPPSPPNIQTLGIRRTDVQIRWSSVGEGVTYRLQLARDEGFQVVLRDEKTDELVKVIKKPPPGTYYVRLSSINSRGYEGEFSKPRSFEITPPPPPHLEKPQMDKKTIQLRWSSAEEAGSYHLQLARDPDFQRIVTDQKVQATRMDLRRPEGPGIYYVRVSSVDEAEHEGPFSRVELFEIKERFPYTLLGVGAGLLGTIGLILLLGL